MRDTGIEPFVNICLVRIVLWQSKNMTTSSNNSKWAGVPFLLNPASPTAYYLPPPPHPPPPPPPPPPP